MPRSCGVALGTAFLVLSLITTLSPAPAMGQSESPPSRSLRDDPITPQPASTGTPLG